MGHSAALNSKGILVFLDFNWNLAKIWDVEDSQCIKTFTGHTELVRLVTFNTEGSLKVLASDDISIRICDV